jgi:hypothetical protein
MELVKGEGKKKKGKRKVQVTVKPTKYNLGDKVRFDDELFDGIGVIEIIHYTKHGIIYSIMQEETYEVEEEDIIGLAKVID